jgi:hypothetical protein
MKEVSEVRNCSERNGVVLIGRAASFVKVIGVAGVIVPFTNRAKRKRGYCL